MLRAALTAFVLATVGAGCGSESRTGPAVVAGAPAGDVTEVSGTVTATRGGIPRPLAVGDVISGDDVIDTGAEGRISITLRHNQVPWTLGPNNHEQVAASLAWRAPAASRTAAGPTGERSGAAGRHAEREAADTSATTTDTAAAAPGAAAAVEPPPPPAAAAAPRAAPMHDPAPPPPRLEQAQRDMPPPPPAAGAPASRGATATATRDDSLSDKGGGGARAKTTASSQLQVVTSTGGLPEEVVERILRANAARLYACQGEVSLVSSSRLVVGTDGKVTSAQAVGVPAEVATCLGTVLNQVSFPSAAKPTTATVKVETVAR